jgi:hypothetical protein
MSAYCIKLKHNFKFATKYEFNSEFCISALAVVKYVFTLKPIYTFCYINSIFGQF